MLDPVAVLPWGTSVSFLGQVAFLLRTFWRCPVIPMVKSKLTNQHAGPLMSWPYHHFLSVLCLLKRSSLAGFWGAQHWCLSFSGIVSGGLRLKRLCSSFYGFMFSLCYLWPGRRTNSCAIGARQEPQWIHCRLWAREMGRAWAWGNLENMCALVFHHCHNKLRQTWGGV